MCAYHVSMYLPAFCTRFEPECPLCAAPPLDQPAVPTVAVPATACWIPYNWPSGVLREPYTTSIFMELQVLLESTGTFDIAIFSGLERFFSRIVLWSVLSNRFRTGPGLVVGVSLLTFTCCRFSRLYLRSDIGMLDEEFVDNMYFVSC